MKMLHRKQKFFTFSLINLPSSFFPQPSSISPQPSAFINVTHLSPDTLGPS